MPHRWQLSNEKASCRHWDGAAVGEDEVDELDLRREGMAASSSGACGMHFDGKELFSKNKEIKIGHFAKALRAQNSNIAHAQQRRLLSKN